MAGEGWGDCCLVVRPAQATDLTGRALTLAALACPCQPSNYHPRRFCTTLGTHLTYTPHVLLALHGRLDRLARLARLGLPASALQPATA